MHLSVDRPTLHFLSPDFWIQVDGAGSFGHFRGSGCSEMIRRYCLTLDLKDDATLIAEYRKYHEKIWPEITKSIRDSGIEDMEIYLLGTRMFMIMEVNEQFSFEAKTAADENNPKVQEWERLMWRFQQALPQASPGEKWMKMERIFKLEG
jgi:L-rhamnose mutarotase